MRIKIFFYLFVIGIFQMSCNTNKVSSDTDFYVSDKLTRSELMQMGATEYREVLRDLTPEVKYKIWAAKIQDVIDHWNLQGGERKIGLTIQKEMSPEMFKDDKPAAYVSTAELYDRLMQKGDPSVQVRLMMAYEMPQTLDDLKTLIHRADYAYIKAECEKDPHMKKLLGL